MASLLLLSRAMGLTEHEGVMSGSDGVDSSTHRKTSVATYYFGDFELDEACFELRRLGARVSVQPKVLQLLLYLVEHRHRIVTTDEFFQVLWPDQVVGETSLTKAVRSARLALGDSGSSQAALKTVRGRGYRFIAPVRERITTHPLGLEVAPRTTASENDNAGALAVTRAISAPARAALHVAAAIGYEFSATLLAAALVSRTAAPNVEPLAAALEEARLAGLIRPVSGVSGSYVFARATIREALCRELSNEKLRELRARIALVLETMEYENELRARTGNSSASW